MAGENKRKRLLMCIGLIVVCMAGCGTPDDNVRTGKNVMEDESTAPVGVNDETVEGEPQDVEPEGEDITFEGSSLSIFGDSISTYYGYIPEGFGMFYPESGELVDVSQTWWMKLLDDTGMELCSNDSSAGSTCVGFSMSVDDPKYGCGSYRLSELTGEQGKIPDVIIIYMGTNDLLKDIPLGDNDGTRWVAEGEIENFSDAYCLILDKIASNYPISQIYCCTLLPIGTWGTEGPFVTYTNRIGLTSEDYSEWIRIIAQNKGIPVIDLYQCGIEIDNLHVMTSDGVHPTPDGMECVERAMLDGLKGGQSRH